MQDRKDITVSMGDTLRDRIEARLEYGDSRSEWIREAVRQKLDVGTSEFGEGETDEATQDVTVPMERSMVEEVDAQLAYGDSRSAWICDACRARLGDDESSSEARAGV